MKQLVLILLLLPVVMLLNAQRTKKLQSANCGSSKCPASNRINISTGINPSNGTVLPVGSIDPAWQLLNYPPLSGNNSYPVVIPKAHVINKYQSGWNIIEGSGILSSINTSTFSSNNQFHSQPWRFKRSFCLCKRSRVRISGVMRADDKGSIHLYNSNGTELYNENTPNSYAFNSDKVFDTTLDLPAGNYHLEFHMINSGGVATGFAVKGEIVAIGNKRVLLNPSKSCCGNNGFISLQKILETKNCNGKIDQGETPGVGWVFNLKNSDGQIIQTKTTDSNGELIFNGLSAGRYIVEEENQSGWIPYESSGGSRQVTVTSNGGTTLKFFNCEGNPTACCPGENLVKNGNFEQGNIGFDSEFVYTNNTVLPGKYGVMTGTTANAQSASWFEIQDPSTCADNRGKFLAVNGQNGGCPLPTSRSEPVPEKKIIWEQSFTVDDWASYKFCFKAKKFHQLGWDITPKIDIEYSFPQVSTETLEVVPTAGVCDWLEYSRNIDLWGYGTNLTIRLVLNQCDHGDGNDLAIDNIALIKLDKCPESVARFDIQTQAHPNYFTVKGIGNISEACNGGYWEICEINPTTMQCIDGTKVSNPQLWWTHTTVFPGYNGTANLAGNDPGHFERGKFYKIVRGTWGKCNGWNAYSMIVYTTANARRVMKFPEKEFKVNKQKIMRSFNKAKLVPRRRN